MPPWDERSPVTSLQELAETVRTVLRLIEDASPSAYGELELLTQTLRRDLDAARAQTLSGGHLRGLTETQQAAFSRVVVDAWERMQVSRWHASPNRDFEHLLQHLQRSLAACAVELT